VADTPAAAAPDPAPAGPGPVRAILDVDTGVDDALALALAVRHPALRLEAALTVAGNVAVDLTTRNTLRVLDWLGAGDVPVIAGADRPLAGGPMPEAGHFHGADGLGGIPLPPPARSAKPGAAEQYLVERLLAEPGRLTLVCLGPLTNLALALRRAPEIVPAVRQVVLMGGTAQLPGNATPVAEFNVHADPEAAALVFAQPWPLVMVGLDVTTRVGLARTDLGPLRAARHPEGMLTCQLARFVLEAQGRAHFHLHDPLAVAVAIDPSLVTLAPGPVHVETRGEHTRGQTVVDLRPWARKPPSRARVALAVDAPRFHALFRSTLGLESRSP
jgi:purine nucleosidase